MIAASGRPGLRSALKHTTQASFMPIEFRCPNCDKKLKTGEDKAGRVAKCPQCATAVTVPAATLQLESDFEEFPAFKEFDSPSNRGSRSRGPRASSEILCPMCGATNAPTAGRCYACGEELPFQTGIATTQRSGNGTLDIGRALSDGWALFRDQLGGLLALCVVTFFVMVAAFIPIYMLFFGGLVAVMAAGGGPNGQPPLVLFALMQIVLMVLVQLVAWFFSVGFTRALLLLVRRKELNVAAIFSGGRYYWLMLINSLVVFAITQGPNLIGQVLQQVGVQAGGGPLTAVGLVLTLVSLVISAIVYPSIWPYTYLIVDDRSGTMTGLEPLRRALQITSGSRLASFALFLLLGIINIAGVFALCVGVIFTAAYMMGTITLAYEQLAPAPRRA